MSLPTSAPQCESKSKPRLSKCIAILHLGKVYAPLETLFVSQEKAPDLPKGNLFQCEECGQHFHQKKSLERHRRLQHAEENPHRCNVCGRTFSWERNLKVHLRVHTQEQPGTEFSQTSNLRAAHEKKGSSDCQPHADETLVKDEIASDCDEKRPTEPGGKFRCQECPYSTNFNRNLHRHLSTHNPHRCEFCGKSFKLRRRLKLHLIVHTKERPFACDFCEKAFGQRHQLTVHLRSHSGERPFSCGDCGERFASSNYLRTHRRVHVDNLLCLHCNFKAAHADSLRLHLRKVHSRDHFCSVCYRGFPLLCELQMHVKTLHSVEKETRTVVKEEMGDDKATESSPSFDIKQEPLEAD